MLPFEDWIDDPREYSVLMGEENREMLAREKSSVSKRRISPLAIHPLVQHRFRHLLLQNTRHSSPPEARPDYFAAWLVRSSSLGLAT